jgi:hypothetical protein
VLRSWHSERGEAVGEREEEAFLGKREAAVDEQMVACRVWGMFCLSFSSLLHLDLLDFYLLNFQ